MVVKKLRLFLLVILLPAMVFMLVTGIQQYQHTAVAKEAGTDMSAAAACKGSNDCKTGKHCSSCKDCAQPKSRCGMCK